MHRYNVLSHTLIVSTVLTAVLVSLAAQPVAEAVATADHQLQIPTSPSRQTPAKLKSKVKTHGRLHHEYTIFGRPERETAVPGRVSAKDGWTWMQAHQACMDTGGHLASPADPDSSHLYLPVLPGTLKSDSAALLWVGAAYLHATDPQHSAHSTHTQPPKSTSAWVWIDRGASITETGAPDFSALAASSLRFVRGLPWAPGFPRSIGQRHFDLASRGEMKSCVAARWSQEKKAFEFVNMHCSSAAVKYAVCRKPAASNPLTVVDRLRSAASKAREWAWVFVMLCVGLLVLVPLLVGAIASVAGLLGYGAPLAGYGFPHMPFGVSLSFTWYFDSNPFAGLPLGRIAAVIAAGACIAWLSPRVWRRVRRAVPAWGGTARIAGPAGSSGGAAAKAVKMREGPGAAARAAAARAAVARATPDAAQARQPGVLAVSGSGSSGASGGGTEEAVDAAEAGATAVQGAATEVGGVVEKA
eukprot:jgi/Ulvmu1/358/UM001_0364.1